MIQLDKISRRFGRQLLFEGLSWMIPRGARLGLVGPNGAGKTTLLRILSGQDQPDEGQVHRAGDGAGRLPAAGGGDASREAACWRWRWPASRTCAPWNGN